MTWSWLAFAAGLGAGAFLAIGVFMVVVGLAGRIDRNAEQYYGPLS